MIAALARGDGGGVRGLGAAIDRDRGADYLNLAGSIGRRMRAELRPCIAGGAGWDGQRDGQQSRAEWHRAHSMHSQQQ